jgi:hypothetical protein
MFSCLSLKCRAFYKRNDKPTTLWALALRARYNKGIKSRIEGPHNALGQPIRLGWQPCGCRVTRGITNRRTYSLNPKE